MNDGWSYRKGRRPDCDVSCERLSEVNNNWRDGARDFLNCGSLSFFLFPSLLLPSSLFPRHSILDVGGGCQGDSVSHLASLLLFPPPLLITEPLWYSHSEIFMNVWHQREPLGTFLCFHNLENLLFCSESTGLSQWDLTIQIFQTGTWEDLKAELRLLVSMVTRRFVSHWRTEGYHIQPIKKSSRCGKENSLNLTRLCQNIIMISS